MPLPLDLVEMGLPAEMQAAVVAVEPCPRLEPPLAGKDPGRLVLTTVNHLHNDVWELTAVDAHGRREQLRPTGPHRFYSDTRHDWVATKDIHDNEVIRGRPGPLTITAKRQLPGTQRVYNLTVEGEHVYYVSHLGLLAHNTCPKYLTVDEFKNLPENGTINPWKIRTSQNTASWNFKPPFHESTIGEAAYQLRQGEKWPSDFGPVKLVEKDGMIWSVDNRRVLTFRSAGMDVPYEKTTWESLTSSQRSHFTSDTNGESIVIIMPK